jgi:predicted nucleic acid-binding protein
MLYFDTNYILKCYLPEPNAHLVRTLAAQPVAKCCSVWGRSEFLAGLHRKLREGSLTKPSYKAVWSMFENDETLGVWNWLPLDRPVQKLIESTYRTLGSQVYLRAGDALHLATAALHGFTVIYSNDKHLLQAATHFSLNPQNVLP